MKKNLLFLIVSFLIILSCKKDNGSTNPPSTGGGSDKDWTISTSSTFLLKDVLDIIYVQDNREDEKFEATVTLSKLSNKNNPNLKGEFQFVIDYDGKSNLNISEPIAFTNDDFASKESVEKNVSIVLPGNISKVGTIKMKMREKLNDKWTEYKYADKTYKTAYAKVGDPTIEGPDQIENEATYTISNATEVTLLNSDKIATLTKVSNTQYKVTKIGTAYGKVTIKATNKDKVSVVKEVVIGVPLPEIIGPESLENEATYTINNASEVVLEKAEKIATLTKVSDSQYKVTKIGSAFGKVAIKATNKAGAIVTKEITIGVALPTIAGAASFETEATYTITNAATVVLENNSNIASLTKLTETTWKVTKIGTAYGKVTIKATNSAGAIATKEITVGVPLPTITGSASFETEATYTIVNATTVVLENNNNIATLTKVNETTYKVTKIGTAYGKVAIKATNKAGAFTTKEVTVGVPLPTITGAASFETEATYTIANAATVVLENNNNIASLTKISDTQYKVTKIGTAYGKVTIKATNSAGAVVKKEITVGTEPAPVPTISGSATVCKEEIYTIKNASSVLLENASGIATLTSLGNDQWKITKIGNGNVIIKAIGFNNNQIITKTINLEVNNNITIKGPSNPLHWANTFTYEISTDFPEDIIEIIKEGSSAVLFNRNNNNSFTITTPTQPNNTGTVPLKYIINIKARVITKCGDSPYMMKEITIGDQNLFQ